MLKEKTKKRILESDFLTIKYPKKSSDYVINGQLYRANFGIDYGPLQWQEFYINGINKKGIYEEGKNKFLKQIVNFCIKNNKNFTIEFN